MGNNSACSNLCADDPVPQSDLGRIEEAYETFCDTQINFAIIGVKEQVDPKNVELSKKYCKEHGVSEKYRFHCSIYVYCSEESKTGYCLEFGELYKKKDKFYYEKFQRFYYHKGKDSAGGVRFSRIKLDDYISNKCKEGYIFLKTEPINGKNYMEKTEKNGIFDVKNFNRYNCNCHKFVLESVTALSAKIMREKNNRCIENFADEIINVIK